MQKFWTEITSFFQVFSSLCAFYAICIGMNNHENADDDASEAEGAAAEEVGLFG